MFWTAHATTALVIAQHTSSPAIGFLAGYISHFFIDAIPHGDELLVVWLERRFKRTHALMLMSIVDSAILLCWFSVLYYFNLLPITLVAFATVIGSLLPDWLTGVFILTNWKRLGWNNWLNNHAHTVLRKTPVSILTGAIIQCSTIAIAVWLLAKA